MKQQIVVLFSFLLLFCSCKGQADKSDKYNTEYSVGVNQHLSNFSELNTNDKFVDSTIGKLYANYVDSFYKLNKQPLKKRDFLNNRSRLILTENINGKDTIKNIDKSSSEGISSFCECNIIKDTLIINSALGMHFAPRRIFVKVFNNSFKSFYHTHNDDYYSPFKLSLNAKFTDKIYVESKAQYLQLDKEPNFEPNQQLTGYLTFTSNVFYEKPFNSERLDTNYVQVKLKFTCITKKY